MDIIKNIKKYILGDSFGNYELLPIGKQSQHCKKQVTIMILKFPV